MPRAGVRQAGLSTVADSVEFGGNMLFKQTVPTPRWFSEGGRHRLAGRLRSARAGTGNPSNTRLLVGDPTSRKSHSTSRALDTPKYLTIHR